ncbi:hypothetical protein CDAR_312101 [Caerostris darwini]|uniref:Uncharacterized protein n=1 Tax=Caerostris darwini TaxID=1538125 RepID=A0AAV4S9P7_9ARAC|nr:hypothetical protein CDAR_312101 [Caerostris darwini]
MQITFFDSWDILRREFRRRSIIYLFFLENFTVKVPLLLSSRISSSKVPLKTGASFKDVLAFETNAAYEARFVGQGISVPLA